MQTINTADGDAHPCRASEGGGDVPASPVAGIFLVIIANNYLGRYLLRACAKSICKI